MALAVAQALLGGTEGNSTTDTGTFDSSTTSGGLLVVLVFGWSPTIFDGVVTDNKGNSFTTVTSRAPNANGIHNQRVQISYCENFTGGASHQITVNPADGSYYGWAAYEVTGALTASALDKSVDNPGNGVSASTGSTGVLSQADEIAFAAATNAGALATYTPDSGWTAGQTTDVNMSGWTGYKIVAATTALNLGWTLDINVDWVGMMLTFKDAGETPPLVNPDILFLRR